MTPGYFAALGIPILRGRSFLEDDRAPDRNPVILSDRLARRMFPGEDPLDKRIRPGRQGPWLKVTGVAGNVKNSGLAERNDPEYYCVRKHSPENMASTATAIIRSAVDPAAMAKAVRAELAALDPGLPVRIETFEQRIGLLTQRPRFNALVLGIFASLGLLLTAVGLYGVMSFVVAGRTQEIGVRMALGAGSGAVMRLIIGRSGRWLAGGILLGAAGSLIAFRWVQTILFGVSASDPWMLAAPLAILSVAALLAAWVPTRRAVLVNPVEALRQD